MTNKTISINPSLFSIGSSKTRKKREKGSTPKEIPIISPNVLKNKLLHRIKEHKKKEIKNLEVNKNLDLKGGLKEDENIKNKDIEFNDEFMNSINYLQSLSKQKKINDEKTKLEELKQKRRENLERRTIRSYTNEEININTNPNVNIELPDELKENIIEEPFHITKPNDVPYGILKGGKKPSYRDWVKTQRNNIVTNPNASLIVQPEKNNKFLDRENRLHLLKQKIKQNMVPNMAPNTATNIVSNYATISQQPTANMVSSVNVSPSMVATNAPPIMVSSMEPSLQSANANMITAPIIQNTPPPMGPQEGGKIIATKHITKKTTKKKYTLGRSLSKNKIGVLIKDNRTRKNVLTAQKELKRKNINDVKKYLREHNLIKTGSNAPNDVLRKLYESSMLSGEITNTNRETLLHNFGKEEK
jgi:hypothetical protein